MFNAKEYENMTVLQAYQKGYKDGQKMVVEHLRLLEEEHEVCEVHDKIKGYVNYVRNTGMGKKKSLEFIEKFIEGLKAESEDK